MTDPNSNNTNTPVQAADAGGNAQEDKVDTPTVVRAQSTSAAPAASAAAPAADKNDDDDDDGDGGGGTDGDDGGSEDERPQNPRPKKDKGKEKEELNDGQGSSSTGSSSGSSHQPSYFNNSHFSTNSQSGGAPPPRSTELDAERFQNLLDRLAGSSTSSSWQESVALTNSCAEEACRILGLPITENILKVFGHQSSGKSSLLEGILLSPLCYSEKGTATMCAVKYRIRKNNSCKDPVCQVIWKKERYSPLNITQMNAKVREIMQSLKAIDKVNVLEVNVEDAKATTLTLIDLPGQISPSQMTTADSRVIYKQDIEELSNQHLAPSANGVVNRIIWVKRATFEKAHDPTTVDMLESADPELARTVIVATFADQLPQICPTLDGLMRQLEESCVVSSRGKRLTPYIVALHEIPNKKGSDPNAVTKEDPYMIVRAEIDRQLKEKERNQVDYNKKIGLTDQSKPVHNNFSKKSGWSVLRNDLQGMVNKDFLASYRPILREIITTASSLEKEIRDLKKKIPLKDASATGRSIVEDFLGNFHARYNYVLQGAAFPEGFNNDYGKTLAQEKESADAVLAEHLSDSELSQKLARFIQEYPSVHSSIAYADKPLLTHLRTNRLMNEMLFLVQSLGHPEFSDADIINAASVSGESDVLNLPSAQAKILHRMLSEQLVPFIIYVVWRMASLMIDSFDPTIALLAKDCRMGETENELFQSRLREAFEEWVQMIGSECEEYVTNYMIKFWGYETWSMPGALESLKFGNPNNAEAGSSSSAGSLIADAVTQTANIALGTSGITGAASALGRAVAVGDSYFTKAVGTNGALPYMGSGSAEPQQFAKFRTEFEQHWNAHKMLLMMNCKHVIPSALGRACEMQATPTAHRLRDYLKKRLLDDWCPGEKDDPYNMMEEFTRMEEEIERKTTQVANIRELHKVLQQRIKELEAKAGEISLSGYYAES